MARASKHTQVKQFRNPQGVVVGEYIGGWLVKRGLDPTKHRLREYNAWATDREHIDWLRNNDGRGVRLFLTDGRVLEAKIDRWQKAFPVNHGNPQLALAEAYWKDVSPVTKAKQEAEAAAKPQQLVMWGE